MLQVLDQRKRQNVQSCLYCLLETGGFRHRDEAESEDGEA